LKLSADISRYDLVGKTTIEVCLFEADDIFQINSYVYILETANVEPHLKGAVTLVKKITKNKLTLDLNGEELIVKTCEVKNLKVY
jgi:hypothetical protein